MSFYFGGVFRRSCVGFALWLKDNAYKPVCQALFSKIFYIRHVCTKYTLKIVQFIHGVIDKIYYIANFI